MSGSHMFFFVKIGHLSPPGPLTVFENGRHTLVGISSTYFQQCGQFPSVYARVTSAVHWIKQVVYYGLDGGR